MTDHELNRLFEVAKQAPVETSPEQALQWIQAPSSVVKKGFKSKFWIMNSIIATTLTAGLVGLWSLTSSEKPVTPVPQEVSISPSIVQAEGPQRRMPATALMPDSTLSPSAKPEKNIEQFHPPMVEILSTPLVPTLPLETQTAPSLYSGSTPRYTTTHADEVKAFKRLWVHSALDVDVVQGDHYAMEVDADEYSKSCLSVRQHGDNLELGIKNVVVKNNQNINIHIVLTVVDLDQVVADGAVYVSVQGDFPGDQLELEASGASRLDVTSNTVEMEVDASGASDVRIHTLRARELDVDVSEAASVKIKGEADELLLEATGSSSFEGKDLVVKSAHISASGASGVKLMVKEKLVATSSGSSSIKYMGNPSFEELEESGAGSIKAMK